MVRLPRGLVQTMVLLPSGKIAEHCFLNAGFMVAPASGDSGVLLFDLQSRSFVCKCSHMCVYILCICIYISICEYAYLCAHGYT